MPTIQIYDKSQVDALIAGAGGLPDPTSASAGDVLTLDSNKDPAWSQPDPGLPDVTSASAGDVLTLDANKDPAWATPAGGSGAGWEELDTSNLPTFSAGDIIKITWQGMNTTWGQTSTVSSWTTTFTPSSGEGSISTSATPYNTLEIELDNDNSHTAYTYYTTMSSPNNVFMVTQWQNRYSNVANWNQYKTNPSAQFLIIKKIGFNGAKFSNTNGYYATFSEALTHGLKIWRLKK